MSYQTHSDLRNALDVLNLSKKTSKEAIISRTNELSEPLEQSDHPEDIARLATIYKASRVLLKNARYGSLTFYEASEPSPLEKRKKRVKYGLLSSMLLILTLAITIPMIIIGGRQDTYDDLEAMMMDFNTFNMEKIGEAIDSLPEGYRNKEAIDEKYQAIMKEVYIIENNDVFVDYEIMRSAYYNLLSTDKANDTWDLSFYLERIDKRILLFGINWESENHYFYLSPVSAYDIGTNVLTDLPGNLDFSQTYRYFQKDNYTVFGVYVVNNPVESSDVYEILSIEEDELRIFCFSNEETYTLTS